MEVPTEKLLHASTTPIHADGGALMLERVDNLWQANVGEQNAGASTSFSFPDELGERAVDFFHHYLALTPSHIPGRRHYNCHIFTAAVRGWLPVGVFDPNLFEWGTADLLPYDHSPYTGPDEVVAGMAYGIVAAARPRHLVHSFIGINDTRHIAVGGNAGDMIIADTIPVMQHYERKLGQLVQLCAIPNRLSVIGTDHWRTGRESSRGWSSLTYWVKSGMGFGEDSTLG